MNAAKFTEKSKEVIQLAQSKATENGNPQIEQAHLLWALLSYENSLISQLVTRMGGDSWAILKEAENAVEKLPSVSGGGREMDRIYISQAAERALNEAEKQAERMTDEYVSVEHIFLGLLEKAEGEIKALFSRSGVTKEAFLVALKEVRGDARVTGDNPRTHMMC